MASRFPKHLSVQTHGGRCCGIKTIWNFPYCPSDYVGAKKKSKVDENVDYYGKTVTKAFDFYTEARPLETATERLDAILAFLKRERPKGLVEVTLGQFQKPEWEKTLTGRGFKLVTDFKNSNTSCKVYVYHLVME
jgi:hypothetical protein